MNDFVGFLNTLPTGLSVVIAFGALVVSFFAFLRPWIKEMRDAKKAKFSESFKSESNNEKPKFFVISNIGPSDAKDIKINFVDSNGDEFIPFKNSSDSHISILASSSMVSIPIVISKYQSGLVIANIEWNDKRRKRQQKKTTLSFTSSSM